MKTKQITILILIFFGIGLNPLLAASITGYIEDATSGEPLPVVSVVIEGSNRGASTNLDGYFTIDYLEPGMYKVLVSNIGYHSVEMEIVVHEAASEPLHIEIQPSAIQLETVEVTVEKEDSRVDRLAPIVSNVAVDAKLVRIMPSLGGEMDVMRALQTIPGVKASSDISAALYVRGGSPDQTLILMDHNVVYNPNHLFGLFSTFNADAVKHINLMKGAFPASYGGRSGSVLEVITNDGNRKKTAGLFSLGLISARASLEGPLTGGRGSYAGSFRRTYLEPMIGAMKSSMDLDLPDYYFYDGNAKVNIDVSDRSTLTLAGYWGNDRLNFDFGDDDARLNAYLSWGNRTFSGRYRRAMSQKVYWSISTAVSRYRTKWSFANEDVLLDKARGVLFDYSVKSDLEFNGGRNHKIKTGLWFSQYDASFKEEGEDLVYADVSAKANNLSLYALDSWRIHPMFELQPGIRAYYHDAGDHVAIDPRLSMVFHYSPDLRLKLAGGRYTQFINVMSLGETFSSTDVWFPIDRTIEPAFTNQIVFGFEKDLPDGLFESDFDDEIEFTTEVYYTDMFNVADFNPMVSEGEEAKDAFVLGNGDAYGVEWMLRKNRGRLTGWLGYSLSWTTRQYENTLINGGDSYYPKWDRRHDFIAISNYKLSRSWDMSASWRYNTGQGFTQAIGMHTNFIGGQDPLDQGNGSPGLVWGGKNNYRFPADHRLDITLTYNHLFFGQKAKLNISVFNVYSRRPYWQRIYINEIEKLEVDGKTVYKKNYKISDAKLLPILPLLSYEVRF